MHFKHSTLSHTLLLQILIAYFIAGLNYPQCLRRVDVTNETDGNDHTQQLD